MLPLDSLTEMMRLTRASPMLRSSRHRIYIKKKPVYHPPAYKAQEYKPSYESSSYSGGSAGGDYAKGECSLAN